MIEASHISKSFGSLKVLSDVSFQIPEGGIYGLIGYNGVGKTTLLKILSGIYRADNGEARVGGEPIYENPRMKQQCFFMTEEATFFDQASLMKMRSFYKGYYPTWNDRTFEGLIDFFGVDPNKKISQFSKGMQRQASLTLAFATGAKYLFLDEAFDGLDFTLRKKIREMLKYYASSQGASLLISSHNLRELEDLADRIGMLNEGELIFDDSTESMRAKYVTCNFALKEADKLQQLEYESIEMAGDAESNNYLCIMASTKEEALAKLQAIGAENINIRPVQLEEFFSIERKSRDVDWKQIFE